MNVLTAVQMSENEDARLIGQGLGSVLEKRGPFDLMLISHGSCSLHGASQHPGGAAPGKSRGNSLGNSAMLLVA